MTRRTPDQMALKLAHNLWQRLYDMDHSHPALGKTETVISTLIAISRGEAHPDLVGSRYEPSTET